MGFLRKISLVAAVFLLLPMVALGATTTYSAFTFDDAGGLASSVNTASDKITISGTRVSSGAWGTGAVNYAAGATASYTLPNGDLTVDVVGLESDGSYGTGTGFKVFVQFWNDPENYIALGLIHDPAVSPDGITLMVEGAAYGQPIGGYWGEGSPSVVIGAHSFEVTWTDDQISWTIDGLEDYRMTYAIQMNAPSFTIMGAAREQSDTVNVAFQNIYLSNVPSVSVTVPDETPRATIGGNVNYNGDDSNVGWGVAINMHDAYGSAISFGYQADSNDPNSDQVIPYLHYNRTSGGTQYFDHAYIGSYPGSEYTTQRWDLKYYESAGKVVFFLNNEAIGEAAITLTNRIFFQVQIEGAQNGDTMAATFTDVAIGGTWSDGTAVTPNGNWNDDDFNFWGLSGSQTGGTPTDADFYLSGTVSGLPEGADWDTIETTYGYAGQPVASVIMVAEWWYNE